MEPATQFKLTLVGRIDVLDIVHWRSNTQGCATDTILCTGTSLNTRRRRIGVPAAGKFAIALDRLHFGPFQLISTVQLAESFFFYNV